MNDEQCKSTQTHSRLANKTPDTTNTSMDVVHCIFLSMSVVSLYSVLVQSDTHILLLAAIVITVVHF